MRHPQRLIGMHFFNPAHRMPLVEIVRRDAYATGDPGDGDQLAKTLRKTPVLVATREGFLVNRSSSPTCRRLLAVGGGGRGGGDRSGGGRVRVSHGAACIDGHGGA